METEYTETSGARIRQFFRELFGSRLVARLEEDLIRLRQDFEARTLEHQVIVAGLREEKALLMSKITIYEMSLMPHASRAGAEVVAYQKPTKPNFSFVDLPAPKSKWQMVQEEHDKQMEKEIEEEKQKAATAASKE